MGRELEYRGNIPDGLALISYIQKRTRQVYDFDNFNFSGWQGNRSKKSGNLVYFSEYFDYLDFVYSADELLKLTSKIESNIIDSFEITIYSQLLADVNYLRDLLGTKFLRENKLLQAAETFKSIEQSYWDEIYNLWERDKDENHVAFDKNPFYVLNYTKPFITSKEIFLVTKLSVTQHLLKYLELADNPRTNDRDYYYFIVGNCYLNMTQYGHSWMMRRFSSNSSSEPSYIDSYIDEIEYRNANLAQKYYHLAYENAKTDKFKALCVRMEEYALNNVDSKYKRLYTTYPEYYNELSTCEFLGEYFKARR